MAINNILPFAQDPVSLVLSQSAYLTDAHRTAGHQPGVARPDLANKNLRQATAMAVGLAQFIADNQITNVDDTLLAGALSGMISNAIKSVTLMPAGSIVWLPASAPPAGTLKVNGTMLSRTLFARLWAFAQTSGAMSGSDALWLSNAEYGRFSPGDASTTFRIPDLRGYVLRAWDDGRGVDVGRALGTLQLDQNVSHTHGVSDPSHAHVVADPAHVHGLVDPSHVHSVNDFLHAHNVNDPTHVHNVNDPTHVHGLQVEKSNESGNTTPWGSGGGTDEGPFGVTTNPAGTGITIAGAGTGVTVAAGPSNISLNAALTGMGMNAATTGIGIFASGTGISIAASGGGEVRVRSLALMPVMFY